MCFHTSTPYRFSKTNNLFTAVHWQCLYNTLVSCNQAGAVKDQSAIMSWIKHIVNHFWYCCKTMNHQGAIQGGNVEVSQNNIAFVLQYCYAEK